MSNIPFKSCANVTFSLGLLGLLAVTGCDSDSPGGDQADDPHSGSVSLRATPLANNPIHGACYNLKALDGEAGVLWQADGLCSGDEGSPGSLEYVGFCDASKPATTLTVELVSISDAAGDELPETSYENPCPVGGSDCSVTVDCIANEDVQAFLPITLLETGDDGFTDIEVEIDAVSCSAKLDCFQADQPGFHLDDANGAPLDTVVMALSCTWDSCADNHIYMNDLVVSCDLDNDGTREIVTTIDPSAPGPVDPASLAANVERAAVYAGESADELTRYVNVSFGLAADAMASCRVESRATASQHPFTAQTTPADAVYPHVLWDVALSDATGALTCSKHPLNIGASGVSTEFTGLDVAPPVSFDRELAETCDGGGGGDEKLVFVSSTVYQGDLGGLAGADAKCQGLADAAGLPGTYLAWLSAAGDSPNTRFVQSSGPYQLVDGTIIANDYADLIDSSLAAPINRDEYGMPADAETTVWTGTVALGDDESRDCNDWTNSTSMPAGHRGLHSEVNGAWTAFGSAPCSIVGHIYCFQQ